MHKVFISYHHANDQYYKDELLRLNETNQFFVDRSVGDYDIDDSLDDQSIRKIIRDKYLKDSTITILLVGAETKNRKHIDWELYSSMYNGSKNKKSGIIVVTLQEPDNQNFIAVHDKEKETIYPECTNWIPTLPENELKRRYPNMPKRIIKNLLYEESFISVISWERFISSPTIIKFLLDATYNDRSKAEYDLSMPMRRANG